jgi:hypothetical protein
MGEHERQVRRERHEADGKELRDTARDTIERSRELIQRTKESLENSREALRPHESRPDKV